MSQALTAQDRERLLKVSVATLSTCLYRAGVKIACPHGIRPVAPAFDFTFPLMMSGRKPDSVRATL